MKNKKIWPVILLIIIIAVAAGIIIYNSTDTARFRKQLDLGHRYLSEMNYEEAVVAFNQAIEIDPRNADAYLGLADAYLGLGDEESALAALQAGYEVTGDERLKARIDEMEASRKQSDENETGISEPFMGNDEITRRIEEITELIYRDGGLGSTYSIGVTNFLTYDQIETVYRPLAEELETYLENVQGDLEIRVWGLLSDIYCHLGEMDRCLEVQRRGYEATGWEGLIPESGESNGYVHDEYGRMVSGSDGTSITYKEAHRYITYDWILNGESIHSQLEYDSLGRIERVLQYESGEQHEYQYQYQSDYSVMVISISNNDRQFMTINYDEYGCYNENDKSEWTMMD